MISCMLRKLMIHQCRKNRSCVHHARWIKKVIQLQLTQLNSCAVCSLCFRVKRSLPSITRSGSISMTTCGQAVFCTQDVPSGHGHTDYLVNIVRPLDHVLLLPRVILCFLCFLNVLRQKVLIDTFISLFLYEKYQGYRVFLNRSSPVSVPK